MKKSLSILLTISTASLLPAENIEPEEAVVLSVLETVEQSARQTDGLEVIDFLTSVYGDHGFYESGGWDEPDPNFTLNSYIALPAWVDRDFTLPASGKITSYYGYRPKYGRLHHGMDIAVAVGDTIRAALPGIVERVGYDMWGYGHFVIIRHKDNVETRYGHLQKALAKPGERVNAGAAIALGGNSGNSTGPHLHFEARCNGTPVDPLSLFIGKKHIGRTP